MDKMISKESERIRKALTPLIDEMEQMRESVTTLVKAWPDTIDTTDSEATEKFVQHLAGNLVMCWQPRVQ